MSVIGKKLIASVRKLAERDPGYVDPNADNGGCMYVRGGDPDCIIGRALWEHGLINESFEALPAPIEDGNRPNNDLAHVVFQYLGLDLDEDEINWLATVQLKQDGQMPWADAVAYADLRPSARHLTVVGLGG